MNKKIKKILEKKNKTKIVSLTAYSKSIGKILDGYCDIVLVGDSMANVLYGLKNTHKIDFNILDLNENILLNIYNGELPIGDKIFIVDSLKLKNGEYYFSIKTIHQNIFRKIIVSN